VAAVGQVELDGEVLEVALQGAVLAGDLDDLRLDRDLDALRDLDGLLLRQGLHRSIGGECDNTGLLREGLYQHGYGDFSQGLTGGHRPHKP
jgi:hypothetical protein